MVVNINVPDAAARGLSSTEGDCRLSDMQCACFVKLKQTKMSCQFSPIKWRV